MLVFSRRFRSVIQVSLLCCIMFVGGYWLKWSTIVEPSQIVNRDSRISYVGKFDYLTPNTTIIWGDGDKILDRDWLLNLGTYLYHGDKDNDADLVRLFTERLSYLSGGTLVIDNNAYCMTKLFGAKLPSNVENTWDDNHVITGNKKFDSSLLQACHANNVKIIIFPLKLHDLNHWFDIDEFIYESKLGRVEIAKDYGYEIKHALRSNVTGTWKEWPISASSIPSRYTEIFNTNE